MRDYKLSALATINLAYRASCDNLKSKEIRQVAKSFVDNLERVVSTGRFPVRLLNLAYHFQGIWLRAQQRLFSDQMVRTQLLDATPRIAEECKKLADEDAKSDEYHRTPTAFSPEWLESLDGHPNQVQQRFEDVFFFIDAMAACTGDFLGKGVESTLTNMVVGTWTAFETFAGDLWVAALNAHPHTLALLAGSEKRIATRVGVQSDDPGSGGVGKNDSDKRVSLGHLHHITNGGYDLSCRMGDMLKTRFNFSVIWDTRKAYSQAFDDKTLDRVFVNTIDAALGNNALDALSIVRNLIVHKSGIADDKYVKNCGRVPAIPGLREMQPLQLDGKIVKSLIDPVVACCLTLTTVLDNWLSAERADG